ncbi:MAG TPA: glycosyltransferase family 1 protein [Silvibacterium sp.]|nr:glycosyltransferase family 1 protein [Silvibacterium sp.]
MSRLHEVVIDARWMRTGIGRYILTLLKELRPRLPDTVLTCITMPAHIAALAPYCDRVIEMNCGIYSLTEQLRLPLAARNASVFCAPHYNIPVFRTGPIVVTIHDLTHLLFPGYRSKMRTRIYASAMLRLASARASRIVVPSHYTRDCLVERLGADATKISVIPCAVGDAFRSQPKEEAAEAVRARHGISAPYLLFVGSTALHKNLPTLLKAYRLLSSRDRDAPHLVLVLPHNPLESGKNRELSALLALPGVHCLHTVSDQSLSSLYSAAVMTIMPSFEEGFGLPVIESMACGTPVACSRAASLPEIAGDAAVYFDPSSTEDLACVIDRLLSSEELRIHLAAQGIEHAAQYSANRAAAAYASMLCSLTTGSVPSVTLENQHDS